MSRIVPNECYPLLFASGTFTKKKLRYVLRRMQPFLETLHTVS